MSEKILVPVLGESITEATVSNWLKNEGDSVEADEPIVELETDKVNLEVPSPVSGVLTKIDSKNGSVVASGDPTSGSSGTNAAFSLDTGQTYFICAGHGTSSSRETTYSINFGRPIGSISSGNADGNGYGNFEYSVPSGYYALNTKNLAEIG